MKQNEHQPPKWADRLLIFFCRPDYLDEILGDLHEAFYWRLDKTNFSKARRIFIWEVIKSLRPKNLKSLYHFMLNTMIFRNYFKIAIRTLIKRRSTAFINILGLSLGVTSFLMIYLYAYQIISFNDYHSNSDRIFLAYKERLTPNGIQATYDTWVPLKDRLKSEYPQVLETARVHTTNARVIKNNQYLSEEIVYTDESLFDIFSYKLLHGNKKQVFTDKYSVVINAETAIKYFGRENPIGEDMEIFLTAEDTTMIFQVSAVIDRFPENISLQPDLLIQLESIPVFPELANDWSSSFLETYVMLDKKESATDLESEFPSLVENLWSRKVRENTNFKLLPFHNYYDEFVGNESDAHTLLFIGIGILLIAIINFMNLSTAQASQRVKEIAMRKVLGAFKGQLRVQFLMEAFIASVIATVLGLAITILAIPYFNDFFEVSISFNQFSLPEIVLFCTLLSVLLGVLSGSYPAIYLSSMDALNTLRQKIGFSGSSNFRNILVVLQFSIALFLIACSLFINEQITYMSQRSMGFNAEEIVVIGASRRDFIDQEQGLIRLNTLKNQLKGKSYIREVSVSRSVPTTWSRSFIFVRPDGWNGDPLRMRYTFVDANFFNTYNIQFKHGSNFLEDAQGDQRRSVVLNEAAMKAFEFDAQSQNVIKIGDMKIHVVGVVEDFNFESLQNEVAPTLIFHRTASNPVHSFISCKMDMSNLTTKMAEIETLWNELGSINDFSYEFMNENVQQLYESEKRYLGLITMFSTLAITVACLGLYGLTLFIIERRRKEISIRKVLGAKINQILKLIFKDFAKWVVLAFILSVPFVIHFMNEWLTEFHYRIDISWIIFVFTLTVVMGLVILTVGYQSTRAATSNPVKYLKDE